MGPIERQRGLLLPMVLVILALLAILSAVILFAHRKNLAAEFAVLGAHHAAASEGEQSKL